MRKVVTTLSLLLCCTFSIAVAQSSDDLRETEWEQFLEQLTADEDNDLSALAYLYDQFCEWHENPFNINTLTRAQLEAFAFLTPYQVEELLSYIYSSGPVLHLGELQLVKGLDERTRCLLEQFVYVGSAQRETPTLRQVLRQGRHQLLTRMDVPLYERAGYKSYSDSILARYPNRKYQGDPYYHSVRYQFQYNNHLYVGFVGEKDAGEPFFTKNNSKGYDYYSYYLMLQDVGRIKTLVVGKYRAGFGLGLVVNNHFSLGKASAIANMGHYNGGLRKHSSTSEYNYLHGVGATLRLGKVDATAFCSYNKLDATLDSDSTVMDEAYITSFKTDGLHRTKLEIAKKNNVANRLVGTDIAFSHKHLLVGVTAVANTLDTYLNPSDDDYKRYYARGKSFYAGGVHYHYFHHRFYFSGETAYSKGGGKATLNLLQLNLWCKSKLTLMQRYYTKEYNALYAQSFCESSVQNECGFYVGFSSSPYAKWQLTGYYDWFRFPYLKYQISYPSTRGVDAMVQLTYVPCRRWRISGKYRYKSKAKDFTLAAEDAYGASAQETQKITLQAQFAPNKCVQLRSFVDYAQVDFITQTASDVGYMFTQQLSLTPQQLPFDMDMAVAYFNTDSYSSRVYRSEKGLLYAYSSTAFYYHGYRGMVRLRYTVGKRWQAEVKYGITHYLDRNVIGTSTQQIDGSTKQDIQLQIGLKF